MPKPKRRSLRLAPALRLRALRALLRKARADLAEQTAWADEYHEDAEELALENGRLTARLQRLQRLDRNARRRQTLP